MSFLDLSGTDPSRAFAEAVIQACGESGPIYIYIYNHYEGTILQGLGLRYPRLKRPLMAIVARLVDLLPIAREHYYHHRQQGSWSLKAVLPTIAPELDYGNLDGVQDGGMAMEAYIEAISPDTAQSRKDAIQQQLLNYCKLDTYATIRLWQHFASRQDLVA